MIAFIVLYIVSIIPMFVIVHQFFDAEFKNMYERISVLESENMILKQGIADVMEYLDEKDL